MSECPTCGGLGLKYAFPETEFCPSCDGGGSVTEAEHARILAAGDDDVEPLKVALRSREAVEEASDLEAIRKRYGPELFAMVERGSITMGEAEYYLMRRG